MTRIVCLLVLAISWSGHLRAETVTARLDSVACSYHDVLWDKTGYDEEGRPTADMLALDVCQSIAGGQELELFEEQNYAPGGLKIVRIDGKLMFVRMRDLTSAVRKAKSAAQVKSALNAKSGRKSKSVANAKQVVKIKRTPGKTAVVSQK